MNRYIINGEVEFIPEDNRLISRLNPQVSVTLTTPSSRCLTLLLENAPQIVSYDVLLMRVWGDNGMIVPLNTLHRNISIIRKGLRKVNPDGSEVIKNISAVGFKVLAVIEVEEIDNSKAYIAKPKITTYASIKRRFGIWYLASNFKVMVVFCFLGFATCACAYILFKDNSKNDFFSDYRLDTTKTGCLIYSNARFNHDIEKQNHIHNAVGGTGFTCDEYPFEYISTYKASSVSSVIKCKKSIMTILKDNCVSFYFSDGVAE